MVCVRDATPTEQLNVSFFSDTLTRSYPTWKSSRTTLEADVACLVCVVIVCRLDQSGTQLALMLSILCFIDESD